MQSFPVKNVNFGVPQGSFLGPLLFLTCVNDLPTRFDCLEYKVFSCADDTSIIVTGITLTEISSNVSKCMDTAQEWLKSNEFILSLPL